MADFIAAVDMGTNSFHMIVARVKNDGTGFKVVDKERKQIRLAAHMGEDLSFISNEELECSIEILKNFKKISSLYNTELKAKATSAVREADNRPEYVRQIYKHTGVYVQTIEGHEEAVLIFKGVRHGLKLHDEKLLNIDIGGGSSEYSLGTKDKFEFAESVKIGAVRLTKKYFPDFVITDERTRDCSNYIEEQIKSSPININCNFNLVSGSSGTIQAAAKLIIAHYHMPQRKNLNGFIFSYDQLNEVVDLIFSKKKLEERLEINGLEEKRADIIAAGILVLQKSFELFNIQQMKISTSALREGIILDELEKRDNHTAV
ncbi:MAG: Ppx/GppA family phosphatase [Ignavibacteriaceae bacterium]|nr:Ppx/GppA family phosphatase [Ignavibacteriaceae bacterium]